MSQGKNKMSLQLKIACNLFAVPVSFLLLKSLKNMFIPIFIIYSSFYCKIFDIHFL